MCVSIFGSRRSSNVLAEGHSRLMGCQFLPMLSSLPGLRIGMIIALCHISGISPVVIEDVSEIVFGIMSEFMRWRVLIPSSPMAVDDLAN